MENTIPTAMQFIKANAYKHELETGISIRNIEEYLIEFTKLHVQAALEEVSKKLEESHVLRNTDLDDDFEFPANCYPLTNIK